ncbi:AMP deaminase 2 [Gaeumannomyces tritici R3-111a-1]|uniref:AMP deaminase n=1 Tax=Gaeumannomyces tritici (strain R3-111a-1) TaxID=644352 RepID=J3NJ59_GAET3|nr:AMP deaminase 2 [Gaeumannomyces tritici R3-111a-1]EJT81309.1 AMP deaminase 2 [Gaeumannomyces tritici R3-111a-1]
MADRVIPNDPFSGPNSPKPSSTQMPSDEFSDDGNEDGLPQNGAGSDNESEAGAGHDDEADLEMGMLARDKQRRTTFYDPVAERHMSQTDAKLFYQRSQRERQKAGSSTPWGEGSPVIAGRAGPSLDDLAHGPLPPSHDLASSPLLHGIASGSDAGTKRDGGFLPLDALRSHGSQTQVNQLAAQLAGLASTKSFGPEGRTGGSTANLNVPVVPGVNAPVGIGSTTFTDADPQVTAELALIFKSVKSILDLRHKYLAISLQRQDDNPKDDPNWNIYPPPPVPAWIEARDRAAGEAQQANSVGNSLANSMVLGAESEASKHARKRKPGQEIGGDFVLEEALPVPGACSMSFRLDGNSVYQVYENPEAEEAEEPTLKVPTIREFYMDLDKILSVAADGPSKSFAYRRLQYLEGKFRLYTLLNDYQETADSKRVPHRDFYNVRKVDTHVHHSACMNQKHLLRFIKSKMKKCPDEVVLFRDGKHLTLAEVFDSINLTAYDLSIDTLDMHAHTDSFHRFDKFNLKYNPVGESRLRTIFLKTDNTIQGRYLAEITKEVIADLESSKYQMVEWRISIYGRSLDEWDKLAAWVVDNKLFSHNVRWLIQIPRLYDVYKASGMENMEQVIQNLFQPLFEVSRDPQSHPKLHIFLQRVIGLDSVDDESKVERRLFKKFPVPRVWDSKQNPPYSYWIYYLFANMSSLNFLRQKRGFNTFVLRPHCGEAGDSEHLAVAALCSHSISHGLLLRKVPILQYVYYLDQIGIAMSPLSNNALFLAYERNPFHQYFKRGLNVSLSTDDPLQFAFTKEPLIEEYAVAAQIYKLSSVDMCELAKNSVKQSGYERSVKEQWLGSDFDKPGALGNSMVKTNVPDRREEFRYKTLLEEQNMVEKYASYTVDANGKLVVPDVSVKDTPAEPDKVSPSLNAPGGDQGQTDQDVVGGSSSSGGGGAAAAMGPAKSVREGTAAAPPSWPADGAAEDLHLSGIQPRFFPGVVARSQTRGGTRQSSMHESDDAASAAAAAAAGRTPRG